MSTKGRGIAVNDDALIHAAKYRANTENRRPPVGADFSGLNEAGILAPLNIPESDYRLAARDVARRMMRDSHGCTGLACTSTRSHTGDREKMHFLLGALDLFRYATGPDVLGLRGPVPKRTDEWGRRISPGKHRGKRAST